MSSTLRAENWAAMARGDRKLGTVRSRASAGGAGRAGVEGRLMGSSRGAPIGGRMGAQQGAGEFRGSFLAVSFNGLRVPRLVTS